MKGQDTTILAKMLSSAFYIFWILASVNAKNGINETKQAQAMACVFNGTKYKNGEQMEGICIDLTCVNGQWVSKGYIDACCRKCHMRDDPHFWSFDKLNFDFHGTCNYSVTQYGTSYNPPFGVFSDFNVCPQGLQWSSCIDIITFKDDANTVITMTAATPWDIRVNSGLPITVSTAINTPGPADPVLVWKSGNCIYLLGTQRLLLQYCWPGWWRELYVFAHPALTNELYGLCGHYNYYKYDDFTHRNLAVSNYTWFYPNAFGESWMTNVQNNRSCLRDVVVKDVEYYDTRMQPIIDKCKQILTDVEVQGRIATAEQLEVHATFCGADLFAFETEVPNEVNVDEYIEAAKEMLRNTITHDVMGRVEAVGPILETRCFGSCGENATCSYSCDCDEELIGYCKDERCKCCKKKPTCGGSCGNGGTCRTCSCLSGEQQIEGQCPVDNCRCCKKIEATTPAPCNNQACGTNNKFRCLPKSVCKQTITGKCTATGCTCCKLW